MNRSIRQNPWDNWYGYEGRRRVRMFSETAEETQEQQAQRWLNGDDEAGFEL